MNRGRAIALQPGQQSETLSQNQKQKQKTIQGYMVKSCLPHTLGDGHAIPLPSGNCRPSSSSQGPYGFPFELPTDRQCLWGRVDFCLCPAGSLWTLKKGVMLVQIPAI